MRAASFLTVVLLGITVAGCSNKPANQVDAAQVAADSDFRSTVASTAFFRGLPPDRQRIVRNVVMSRLYWEELRKQAREDGPSGIPEDPDTLLSDDEERFLIKGGVLREPEWPGYKTYRAEKGIFVLVPAGASD